MTSFIHRDLSLSNKSELDLFSLPPTQFVTEKVIFVEYHPLSTLKYGIPTEFIISGNGEEYIDLKASYLHVKGKVTLLNGTNLLLNEPVAITNFILHSSSEVDVSLNKRNIFSVINTYHYREPTSKHYWIMEKTTRKVYWSGEGFLRQRTRKFKSGGKNYYP